MRKLFKIFREVLCAECTSDLSIFIDLIRSLPIVIQVLINYLYSQLQILFDSNLFSHRSVFFAGLLLNLRTNLLHVKDSTLEGNKYHCQKILRLSLIKDDISQTLLMSSNFHLITFTQDVCNLNKNQKYYFNEMKAKFISFVLRRKDNIK